ncbi:acyl carrier protein [Streptomyces ferrugineus]|uniref:Acyl carrier protein n=1 Tax=Streptomyces ferrugineus TaxID=1413221 RepID=A0A7M2SM73_9ACTN|nr:acyl carrier protein [Streptomyces ferrugineus]QOV36563.1 acyl carrier protein [Streptomyces ferrugineus]
MPAQHRSHYLGDLVFTPGTPQPDSGESSDSAWLQAFREVLESADIDEDTNFFQAGGHSLLIPKLLSRYASLSGWRPPASLLFKFSSPRELEAESALLYERTAQQGSR